MEAALEGEIFAWFPSDVGASADTAREWLSVAIAAAENGERITYAILEAGTGRPVGSTSFLEIAPEAPPGLAGDRRAGTLSTGFP